MVSKTMKKLALFAATLLLVGAGIAACTKDEPDNGYIQDPTDILPPGAETNDQAFSATLASRGEGKSWPLNAELSLQYEKRDGRLATALATVVSVNDEGAAQISATLTDAKDGATLKLVYPASLANLTGDDIDPEKLSAQNGTLADIRARFDAATGTATLQTKAGATASLSMESRVSIVRFAPAVDGAPLDGILSLRVSDGVRSYTATAAEGSFGTEGIYLAMLPVSEKALSFTATTATASYEFSSEALTLRVGISTDLDLPIREPAVLPGQTPAEQTPAEQTPAQPIAAEETPAAAPESTMLFTATLAAKGQSQTKSVNESGVTTWGVGEKIAVYYETTNGTYDTAEANVDAVNDGKATISATLAAAKDGGVVKFVYPASLAGATGDLNPAILATQHGTIADISAHFDAATATATLVTDGTTCGTTASVSMTNRVLIGKFTPQLNSAAIDGITSLTISDGTYTYTVTPAESSFGTGGIYVAMLPVDNKTVTIHAVTATQEYSYTSSNPITLVAGKLYNSLTVPMGTALRSGYGNANNI